MFFLTSGDLEQGGWCWSGRVTKALQEQLEWGVLGARAHLINQGFHMSVIEAPRKQKPFNHTRTLRERRRCSNWSHLRWADIKLGAVKTEQNGKCWPFVSQILT